LAYVYDFEWSNKQFAYGDYVRTNSFFENSELAAHALPDEGELALLEEYRGKIPDEVFTTTYKAPVTDGSGNVRKNLRIAAKMLDAAGYDHVDDNGIRYKAMPNGDIERLSFEILHYAPTYERWVLPFIKNLKRIGVQANFRLVDSAQFQNRMNDFDFDMVIGSIGQSGSPGNEQREYWGAEKADVKGSRNYIGIKDPVVDDLISKIIHATSREDLIMKTRVLDRVLLWNHYVIPMWHYPKWRIAYWNNLKRPDTLSGIDPLISQTWWAAPQTETKE